MYTIELITEAQKATVKVTDNNKHTSLLRTEIITVVKKFYKTRHPIDVICIRGDSLARKNIQRGTLFIPGVELIKIFPLRETKLERLSSRP